MSKDVLFVATELYGTRAGSFRQERWIKAFIQQGYICHVFDNLSWNGNLRSFDSLQEFIQFRADVRMTARSASSIKEGAVINILRNLKHFFLWEVLNPLNIIHLAIILARLNRLDVVFASTPPFSSAAICYWYKLFHPKSVFIIDFRDEWAEHPFLPQKTIFPRRIFEKIIVKKADKFITVSKHIQKNIETRNDVSVDVIYNAPDIMFDSTLANQQSDFSNVGLSYTGSLPNNSYDVQSLHQMLIAVNDVFGRKMNFNFIGSCDNLKRIGEVANTSFTPNLPLREVREVQRRSDILIFLGADFPNNGGIVSAKIFEYLQSGKPILPLFVHPNSDVYDLIKEACGFCLSIFDTESLINVLNQVSTAKTMDKIPRLTNPEFMNSLLEKYQDYPKHF